MKIYKKKNYTPNIYIVAAIMFLSPLLSLPLILRAIYDRQKGAFLLFSIFVGLLAFLTPPFADLYRHYENFVFWQGLGFSDFTLELFLLNGLIQIPYIILVNSGYTFEYVRLIELFFAALIICKIFNDIISHASRDYTKKEIFTRFLLVFCFFNFFYIVLGVRFGFALCLYSLGIHYLINKKRPIIGLLFWFLSIGWHYGLGLFSIPAFILYKLNFAGRKSFLLFLGIAFGINAIMTVLSPLTADRSDWYFSGDNIATSYGGMTRAGFLLTISYYASVVPLLQYVIRHKEIRSSKKIRKLMFCWLIISVSFVTNAVVFGRVWWGVTYMAVIAFLISDSEKNAPPKDIQNYNVWCVICIHDKQHVV